jgi:hypothetical protein
LLTVWQIATILMMVTVLLGGCASSGRNGTAPSELEQAIALYIDGDYEGAAAILQPLTRAKTSDEATLTSYLYLGRTYMAMGEYGRAADVFSTGLMIGGGTEFEEYLAQAQGHLRTIPRVIRNQDTVTRAELAALLAQLTPVAVETDAPQGPHWASGYIDNVRAAGLMPLMPDERFYPEREVTTAAFYVSMLRLAAYLDVDRVVVDELYPDGLRSVLKAPESDETGNGAVPRRVTGEAVIAGIEAVAASAGERQ